jgi:hypothetical protein
VDEALSLVLQGAVGVLLRSSGKSISGYKILWFGLSVELPEAGFPEGRSVFAPAGILEFCARARAIAVQNSASV